MFETESVGLLQTRLLFFYALLCIPMKERVQIKYNLQGPGYSGFLFQLDITQLGTRGLRPPDKIIF